MDITVHIVQALVLTAGIVGFLYFTGVIGYIKNLD